MSALYDLSTARPGQKEAIAKGLTNFYNKDPWTPIILPTRYGKSDIIRMLAIIGWALGHIAVSIVISPNRSLRDQVFGRDKFAQMYNRYSLQVEGVKYKTVETYRDIPGMVSNGEMMLSITIQLANEMKIPLIELVDHFNYKVGLPVAVFIDETHLMSVNNTWGDLATSLSDAGALIVPLTATPFRTDGEDIPGIKTVSLSSERIKYRTYQSTGVINKVKYLEWEANKKVRIIDLDWVREKGVYVSFRQAWDENLLCKINHVTFDHNLTKELADLRKEGDNAPKDAMLSLLTASEVRNYNILGKVTRDSQAIIYGVKLYLKTLSQLKRMYPEISGMIYCGNDMQSDKEVDKQAKRIKKYIKELDISHDVLIATSSNDNDGAENVSSYADGKGDTLIVKQMAGAGIDVPRAKVELDLSSIRTANSFIQRVNRVATPYKDILVCHYISPEDAISKMLYQEFIDDEGGGTKEVVGDRDLIGSGEIDVDKKSKPVWHVNDAKDGTTNDSEGDAIDGASRPSVQALADIFPEIKKSNTDPQILRKIESSGIKFNTTQSEPEDVNLIIKGLGDDCNDKAATILGSLLARDGYYNNREKYAEYSKRLWNTAKTTVGISPSVKLRDITNTTKLKSLKQALTRWESEL